MSFKDLIDACNAELDVADAGSEKLAKALSSKDDKDEQIKDMAAKDDKAMEDDDAEDDEDSDEDESEDEGTEADAMDGENELGKSLTLTGPDNEPVEVYDGTALVKSLVATQERIARHLNVALAASETLAKKLDEQDVRAIEQEALIKSLQDRIERMGKEGRGRKSVLNVHEKPQVGASDPRKPDPGEYMAKARKLFGQGRMDSYQIARTETYLGRGIPLPLDLEKLLGSADL